MFIYCEAQCPHNSWRPKRQLFDLVTRNKLYTKMNGTRYWNILSRTHILVNISSKSSTSRIAGFQNRPPNPGFEKVIPVLNKSLKRDFSELQTTLSLSGFKVHKTAPTCKSLVDNTHSLELVNRLRLGSVPNPALLSIPSKAFVRISNKF